MDIQYVADPCRNFCIMSKTVIIDPYDNREKIVLSNFVDSGNGNLIFIDRQTGKGESFLIPADEGAWALLNYKNKKLLVGTCSQFGYLHSFDLATRKWDKSLRDPDEQYIWNFALASDGKVYGGTWPGGVLLQYDPEQHKLNNLGNLSGNKENMYMKSVNGELPGYVIVTSGMADTHLYARNLSNGKVTCFGKNEAVITHIGKTYIRTLTDGVTDYYSTNDFSPIDFDTIPDDDKIIAENPLSKYVPDGCIDVLTLSDGSLAGVRGQEYFIIDKNDPKLVLKKIPVESPATRIMTLTDDGKGNLWGSCALGQTIFRYNLATGESWNSAGVCNEGGEVYGMRFIDGKLFLSSYSHGDHIVYDPTKPWNQIENKNPITLRTVSPDLIRPTGWSVIGPDGMFWTGWSAKYGVYGGGLSRIDPKDLSMKSWYDPIPEQEVTRIDTDDRYIYFATDGEASGRASKKELFHFVVWDVKEERIIRDIPLEGVNRPFCSTVAGENVLVGTDDSILVFNRKEMKFIKKVEIGEPSLMILVKSEDTVLLFSDKNVARLNLSDWKVKETVSLPALPFACCNCEGTVYFSADMHLYKLNV